MDSGTKKCIASIYYFGLIAGALLMNYIIVKHNNYAMTFIENFQELDKLNAVNQRELFAYILFKRAKQFLISGYLYFYIAKPFVLYVVDFYFAFIMGSMSSLFVYYYGFTGLCWCLLLFVPIFIFYGSVYYIGWLNCLNKAKNCDNRKNRKIIIVICLILLGIFAEISVNMILGLRFFNNK